MHRENETALGKPYIQQTNILAIPTNHPPFPSITQMGRKKLRRKWQILANSATKLGKKLKKFQFMTSNKNWKDFVDTDVDISMFQKMLQQQPRPQRNLVSPHGTRKYGSWDATAS